MLDKVEIDRGKYIKILLIGIVFLIQYIILMKVGNMDKVIITISKILYSIGSVMIIQQLFLSMFILFSSSYYVFIFAEMIDGISLYLLNKYFFNGIIFIQIICFVVMFFYVISEVHGVNCLKQIKKLNEKMDSAIQEIKSIYKNRRILVMRYNNSVNTIRDRINNNTKGYEKIDNIQEKEWEETRPLFTKNIFGMKKIFETSYYLYMFKCEVDEFFNEIQSEIRILGLENEVIEARIKVFSTHNEVIEVDSRVCYQARNDKLYDRTIDKTEEVVNSAEEKFIKDDKRARKYFEKFMKKSTKRRK